LVNEFILTDIYDVAGRENVEAKSKVSAQSLASDTGAKYVAKEDLNAYLSDNAKDNEIILIISAGDFYTLG
jgi:UDP-N-acetylmuramate-alanine ligase